MISKLAFWLIRRSSRTWRSQVLPTKVTTGVSASKRTFRLISWEGLALGFRVVPKDAIFAFFNFSFFTRLKKSASRGFEPG